eukprot:TRINITY_DN61516_c0_g1_i1.p1 TRINITY_DN61516_c0_g1~~TRINITY_DN61516_c0_g1_i1.p1  ORF type:complete len:728 (+),score=153.98 TRINITY_DN61516_c0_g1_i1:116-2299(+)
MGSEAGSNTGVVLEESLGKTRELSATIQQWIPQQEECDRRLSVEVKSHRQTKDRIKAIETEHVKHRDAFDKEKREHNITKAQLEEKERINVKAQEALKALADDLVSVRLQNEALRAEMEVQRKAFVVNVNWAARHAELKTKHEETVEGVEMMQNKQAVLKDALEAAVQAQEEYMGVHGSAVAELERVRTDLKSQEEKICAKGQLSDEANSQLAHVEHLKRQIQLDVQRKKANKVKLMANMERALGQRANALELHVFCVWSTTSKRLKLEKGKKEQNTAMAMRGIANSAMAIQDFCLTAWHKLVGESRLSKMKEAQRDLEAKQGCAGAGAMRSRQKALSQIEKQLLNQSSGLLREVMMGWVGARIERLRKEKIKSMATRGIGDNDKTLTIQLYHAWLAVVLVARSSREKKVANNLRAMRMITDGATALLDFCLTQWANVTKKAVSTKRAKEKGSTRAARIIATTQAALKAQCVQLWSLEVRKLRERNKKMRTIERSLARTGAQLLQLVVRCWKDMQDAQQGRTGKKIRNLSSAEKMITNSTLEILKQTFNVLVRHRDDSKNERLGSDLAGIKPRFDEAGLEASKIRLAQLRQEMEEESRISHDTGVRIQSADERVASGIQALQRRENQIATLKKELDDSRKKARDINEELAKVGLFLQGSPTKRRPSPSRERPKTTETPKGAESTSLPRIDCTFSRPRSGGQSRAAPVPTAPAAAPAPLTGSTKTAWE